MSDLRERNRDERLARLRARRGTPEWHEAGRQLQEEKRWEDDRASEQMVCLLELEPDTAVRYRDLAGALCWTVERVRTIAAYLEREFEAVVRGGDGTVLLVDATAWRERRRTFHPTHLYPQERGSAESSGQEPASGVG